MFYFLRSGAQGIEQKLLRYCLKNISITLAYFFSSILLRIFKTLLRKNIFKNNMRIFDRLHPSSYSEPLKYSKLWRSSETASMHIAIRIFPCASIIRRVYFVERYTFWKFRYKFSDTEYFQASTDSVGERIDPCYTLQAHYRGFTLHLWARISRDLVENIVSRHIFGSPVT